MSHCIDDAPIMCLHAYDIPVVVVMHSSHPPAYCYDASNDSPATTHAWSETRHPHNSSSEARDITCRSSTGAHATHAQRLMRPSMPSSHRDSTVPVSLRYACLMVSLSPATGLSTDLSDGTRLCAMAETVSVAGWIPSEGLRTYAYTARG